MAHRVISQEIPDNPNRDQRFGLLSFSAPGLLVCE